MTPPEAMPGGAGPRRLRRLLALLPSDRVGGTERHTAALLGRLARQAGLRAELAADPALEASLRPLLGAAGWRGAALAGGDPAGQQDAAARLIAEAVPDALLLPLPWPDAGDGLLRAAAAAALPRLVLLHLAPEPAAAAPCPAAPVFGLDRAVVAAVSAPVARRAARAFGLGEAAVALLPNPAPPPPRADRALARATIRHALGLPAEAPLLLFLGRLEAAKGADLLPAVTERLDATLVVAGEGELRGLLDSRAAGDPRRLLRPLGALADPSPWLLAADALLLPSRLEGAPLAFLEAASHGCPVVASPAALEALGPQGAALAWIAADGGAPALAEAAAAALADPAGRAARTARAAAHAASSRPEATDRLARGLLRLAMFRGG